MSSDHAATIRAFYDAFHFGDGAGMAALYRHDVRFHDPVFGELRGARAGAMWRMLTGSAQDLRVELGEHAADGDRGTAHWTAHYVFTRTGRAVANEVDARFRFADDGLIAEHEDHFGLWRWTRQALGAPGVLLGWTPIVRRPLRRRATASLDEFCAAPPADAPPAEADPSSPPPDPSRDE